MAKLIHVYVGNSSSEINWKLRETIAFPDYIFAFNFLPDLKMVVIRSNSYSGPMFIHSIKFSCVLLFTAIFSLKILYSIGSKVILKVFEKFHISIHYVYGTIDKYNITHLQRIMLKKKT